MEQSSIIIHKGGREDKYQIYVEDYVLSFLKEETETLELSEFYFYGSKEKNDGKYIIYGAGRNSNLAVFDKYNLLEEVGCRLTQAGPVFLIKEEDGTKYEIKGYEVFYQDNREMQNYLIDQKNYNAGSVQTDRTNRAERFTYAQRTEHPGTPARRTPHNVITMQLGVILVALVAIVINSTNSYDKMQELNKSAEEVFFAMENQEVENVTVPGDEKTEIVVERDMTTEEDILKLATLENEEQTEKDTGMQTKGETEEHRETEEAEGEVAQSSADEDDFGKDGLEQSISDDEGELEALSRNVMRYYEVERGDTLYTISKKIYGDTAYVQKICELNQIADPDNIRYGQKIILP